MKIIFLDIDGVLNSEIYYRSVDRTAKDWSRFDPTTVDLIKKLVNEFFAQIVISSTWRFGAVQLLNSELKKSGLIKYLYKDWKTPQGYPPSKGKEIKEWLDQHTNISEYVIIDDDESILEEQKSRFVKTDLMNGMKEKHYARAREILIVELKNN